MADEWVVDASVAVKCFLTEAGSDEARSFAASSVRLIAPDLIHVEVASVSLKRLRRGDIGRALAEDMVSALPELLDEVFPIGPLALRAQGLALDYDVSAYDALYVALAEIRESQLITADLRLWNRLQATPLARSVKILMRSEA